MEWPMGCIDNAPAVGSTSFEGPNSWRALLIDTSTNRSNGSTTQNCSFFSGWSTHHINSTCAGFRWAFAAPQELCCLCGGGTTLGTTLISRGREDDGSLASSRAGLTVGLVLAGSALLLCIVLAVWYVRGYRGPSSVGGPTPIEGGPSFVDVTKSDEDGLDVDGTEGNDLANDLNGNVEQRGARIFPLNLNQLNLSRGLMHPNPPTPRGQLILSSLTGPTGSVLSPATPRTIASRITRVRNSVRRSASTTTASKPFIVDQVCPKPPFTVELPTPSGSGALLSPELQSEMQWSRGRDHSDKQDDEQDDMHDDCSSLSSSASSTPSMYSTVSIKARHGSFSPCGAHSLHPRTAKAQKATLEASAIGQFTLDELLVSGCGQWPGIDELLTAQLNESPQDRMRRLEWIRHFVSQAKPQKAYELGWDGKRFLTADLGASWGDQCRGKYPWSDLSVVAELGIERALAMEARMHPRARAINALFQGDDDHDMHDDCSSLSSSASSTPSMYSTVSIKARHGSFSPCGAHSHRRMASKAKTATSNRRLLSLKASIGQFESEESTRAPPQESREPSLQPGWSPALANKADSGIIPRPSTPGTAAFAKDEDKAEKVDEAVSGTPSRAPASTPASGRKLMAKSRPFWELRAEKDARKSDKRGRMKLSPRSEAILVADDDVDDVQDVETVERRSKSFDVARKWTLSMEAKVYDEESEDSEEKERSVVPTRAPRREATLEQFMNRLEARRRSFVVVDSPHLMDL